MVAGQIGQVGPPVAGHAVAEHSQEDVSAAARNRPTEESFVLATIQRQGNAWPRHVQVKSSSIRFSATAILLFKDSNNSTLQNTIRTDGTLHPIIVSGWKYHRENKL